MDLQQRSKGHMEPDRSRRGKQLYRQFLKNASEVLSFSEDVMSEMGADGIKYSKTDFSWLFCASAPLTPGTTSKSRKKAGMKVPHIYLKAQENKRDLMRFPPPLILPPLNTTHDNSLTTKELFTAASLQGGILDAFNKTGLKGATNVYSGLKEVAAGDQEEHSWKSNWEEFVLKKLSKTTARWIVSQQIPRQCKNKARLRSLLRDLYGSASISDLVTDELMCEEDYCELSDAFKPSVNLKPFKSSKTEVPSPVYYKVQSYDVPPVCTDEQSRFKPTANYATIKHTETPKPSGLQDSLKPQAGKHQYPTENDFEQKPYSAQMGRVERGALRWMDLPTKADYAPELDQRALANSEKDTEVSKQQVHHKPLLELSSLRYAVEQWRKAWMIKIHWQSVTVESLKMALTDPHYNIRLTAIATCALGAVNRPQEGLDLTETAHYCRKKEVDPVPPELQALLLSALSDPVKEVQIAAAVCQYAMGTPNTHARDILRNALNKDCSGSGADSWFAAQCLVMEGEASQAVAERLLSQHFLSEAPSDQDQAATLLATISNTSTLVRSRLAEELNCANCRNRVLACNIISRLKCSINKDLRNKLIYLIWNDWSSAVRQAAAQALDRLGMSSDIHDQLRIKLDTGPTSWRVEALVLISQLKIMTAKLLPAFLRCLHDDFVVVRKQACLTAASLKMKNEIVLDHLIELMKNDASCDVKVIAINALGEIGCLTPGLQELLLWALCHEEEPSVRIAACEALKTLAVKGPELQHHLQQCLVLEPNLHVQRHIEEMMKSCGYSLEEDKSMVQRITDQVQKLCSKSIITEKVLLLEELEQMQQDQKKLLGKMDQPVMTLLLQKRISQKVL